MYKFTPTAALYLIEAPDPDDVVSLAAIKNHCRVNEEDTDHDDSLTAYRDAAIQYLDGKDGYLQRALAEQTWELRMSSFPWCGSIEIPLPPLIEVVSIKYIDTDGAEQTVDSADYHVVGESDRGKVSLRSGKAWPSLGSGWPEPVIVRFRAGYIDATVSPAAPGVKTPIVQAIKLLTEHWFDNRSNVVIGQTVVQLPWAVEALLLPYRIF